jgi:hypothetical protein
MDVLHDVIVIAGKAARLLPAAQTSSMSRAASLSVWAMYAPSTLGRQGIGVYFFLSMNYHCQQVKKECPQISQI